MVISDLSHPSISELCYALLEEWFDWLSGRQVLFPLYLLPSFFPHPKNLQSKQLKTHPRAFFIVVFGCVLVFFFCFILLFLLFVLLLSLLQIPAHLTTHSAKN